MQGMRWRGYDAALSGDAQFMRRHSLAILLVTPAVDPWPWLGVFLWGSEHLKCDPECFTCEILDPYQNSLPSLAL